MNDPKWRSIKKKAIGTIRLVVAPNIKCNYLKLVDLQELLEKLEIVYSSKSLTNKYSV